jgi:hypothetical protein
LPAEHFPGYERFPEESMFGLSRKKPVSGGFWQWLDANSRRLQAGLQADPQGTSQEISRAFERAYPDLTWEVSFSEVPPWLFCVSADGRPELFDRVRDAVSEAPAMSEWKVQPFRPRGSLDAEIDMGGRVLGYGDVWCAVEPLGGGVGVTLCIRGLSAENEESLSSAAAVLMDNAVGEYDGVMKVRGLARAPLPPDPRRTETFFPLAELPGFLDSLT